MDKKITVSGVLNEGIQIGIKNSVSLFVAVILWLVTLWIPYLNVGTTIALTTIPIELSKGKIISPGFIFDAKYRKYMGEYFNLIGLMMLSIIPAFFFMIIPAYVIAIGWSLAFYIMLDKGVSPSEALVQSNKATYGYKFTIFLVIFIIGAVFFVGAIILKYIPYVGPLLIFILYLLVIVTNLGCFGVIYRDLAKDKEQKIIEVAQNDVPPTQNDEDKIVSE